MALFYGAGVLLPAFPAPLPWPVQNANSFDSTGDVVYVNTGATVTNEGHYPYGSDNIQIQTVSILNTDVLQATLVPDGGTTNVTLTGLQAGVSAVKLSGLYFDWSVENPDHTWGAWVTNTISYGVLVRTANGAPPGLPIDYTPLGSRAIMGSSTVEQWYQGGTNGTIDGRRTDVIDIYMEGGPCSWVYQNSDWDANWYPGKYLYTFIRGCKRQGRIPCVVFYCIPPSGVGDSALRALKSVNESTDIVGSDINRFGGDTNNPWWSYPTNMVTVTNYMIPYYQRTIRVMRECLQKMTGDGWPCLVVIEPDFIGYMSTNLGDDPVDPNATNIVYDSNNYTFKVSRAFEQGPGETNTVGTNIYTYSTQALLDAGEQAQFPNTLKGFVTSIPYIFRKEFELNGTNVQLGTNVMIGWKLNLWASKSGTGYSGNVLKPTGTPFGVGKGIIRWTDAEGQGTPPNSFSNIVEWLREEAAGIANYYVSAGITNNTDYLFIDRYGIDAASAGYVTNPASSTWFWNHDHWNNYLAFVESVQHQVRLPIVLWQLPMGHLNTTDTKKADGTTDYTPLSNGANSGSFEDSSATFWFGDTFTPGGADRMAYFSTNQWGGYDPNRAADVTVTESKITWAPAIDRLRALNVAALLSGPGVGSNASTFACAVNTAASTDDFWWMNQAQRHYLRPGNGYIIFAGVCADFDGDGKADPTLYVSTTGNWYFKLSSLGYSLATINFGGTGYSACVGDYDGDDKADPAVYQVSTGNWYIQFSGNGYTMVTLTGFGGETYDAVAGDYDGDGLTDPAIYNIANGDWQVGMSSLGYGLASAEGFGGTGYTAVQANYDSDNRFNAAVYNNTNGNWTVLLSASSYITGTLWGFGGEDYTPVMGDFDGDGLADPAVYQESTGNWYVKLSGSQYAMVSLSGFGGTGYQVSTADLDGDGKADPTLFETTTGMWHIKLSSMGYGTASIDSGYLP